MKIEELLKSPTEWVKAEGPNSKIVLSSRVRLARNLQNVPFPGWAKKAERQKTLEMIRPVVEKLTEMGDCFSDCPDSIFVVDFTRSNNNRITAARLTLGRYHNRQR